MGAITGHLQHAAQAICGKTVRMDWSRDRAVYMDRGRYIRNCAKLPMGRPPIPTQIWRGIPGGNFIWVFAGMSAVGPKAECTFKDRSCPGLAICFAAELVRDPMGFYLTVA